MTKERVQPAGTSNSPQSFGSRRQRFEVAVGFAYLYLSLACGLWYLSMLAPSMQNDLWWAHYNISGYQSFLIDIANVALMTTRTGTFDLMGASATMHKAYMSSAAYTSVYPTYPNRVILDECTSVAYAVANLRNLSAAWSTRMMTQYCWVDFKQQWELAHTAGRVARCYNRYAANGAMYLEAVLRNTDWVSFTTTWGGPGNKFTQVIQNGVLESPTGAQWFRETSSARDTTTVDDEITYWLGFNITAFQLQWGNKRGPGISESLVLQNALGMQHMFVIKNVPLTNGPWTSMSMYWRFLNDLFVLQTYNRSLVRQSNRFYGANITTGAAIDFEVYQGLCASPGVCTGQTGVFHSLVGPFLSIDMFYIAAPPPLIALWATFQAYFAQTSVVATLKSAMVRPTPPAWANANYTFYGGNPMCLKISGTALVQQSFDFSDACAGTKPLAVTFDPPALLFALLVTAASPTAACAFQPQTFAVCNSAVTAALALLSTLPADASAVTAEVPNAVDAIARLRVGFMQYATTAAGSWMLLTQPALEGSSWDVVGYVVLADWVRGKREVVSFEGDVSSLMLLSNEYAPMSFATPFDELKRATQVFYYLCMYTSVLLVLVASLCTFYGMLSGFRVMGRNLLRFNRVVGSVWIGRPLLIVRGGTALLLLSTSQVILSSTNGVTHFATARRSFLETIVVAGEATWVTYVVNDVRLLVVPGLSVYYAPVSSLSTWLLFAILESADPVQLTATFTRQCDSTDMDYFVACSSGVVEVGSTSRLGLLLLLQSVVIVVALAMAWAVRRRYPAVGDFDEAPFLISSATNTFFTTMGSGNVWAIDRVSCIMAGLVPFTFRRKHFTFDLKSWLVVKDTVSVYQSGVSQAPEKSLHREVSTGSVLLLASSSVLVSHRWDRALAVFGFLYMAATIAGSLSYLEVAKVNLANDLWWANFNITGAHAFLANWYNEQLYLGAQYPAFALDTPNISQAVAYGMPGVFITSAANFGANLQHTQLSALIPVIAGFRRMDACNNAPWIFTQYCFADFDRRWSLANTALRQRRCEAMTTNGAVYLEGMLRNLVWDEWQPCWGEPFNVAVGNELRRSQAGHVWLESVEMNATLSVADEADFWHTFGIRTFDTQWQNFKQVGLISSYAVESAYATVAALTLQALNGSFRFSGQTTFKAYWALGNDLYAVSTNASGIGGLSLVRSSPLFAFANQSFESVLAINGTLALPFGAAFTFVRTFIGPFGSIDLHYVPVPAPAQTLFVQVLGAVRRSTMASNQSQTEYLGILVPNAMYPVPTAWLTPRLLSYGGSPLCPDLGLSSGLSMATGMVNLLSFSSACSSTTGATAKVTPTRDQILFAVLLARLSATHSWATICAIETNDPKSCASYLRASVDYLNAYVLPQDWSVSMATATTAIASLDISLLQFTRTNKSASLVWSELPLLNAQDPDFVFYSWCYLAEWIQGFREVVVFEGDAGARAILTDQLLPLQQGVSPWEIPTTMATYARVGAQYVTLVVLSIAVLACGYILVARGYVEGLNMLELSRVGGIVWVGRPLLFLRSLTALAVLCTGSLDLATTGSLSYLHSTAVPWFKTCLAASEVSWLVSIVNDVLILVTKEYTALYVTPNGLLVTATTAALSLVAPVTHSASLKHDCSLIEVDFQVVCTGGTIVIGVASRVVLLIALVGAYNMATVALVRMAMRHKPVNRAESLLLYAGAKYLFLHVKWIHEQTYYLDRASAVLNGLVTLRYQHTYYGLDIKTWRSFTIPIPQVPDVPLTEQLAVPAKYALPLDNLSAIEQAIKKSQQQKQQRVVVKAKEAL
ncbi:hypothetical protein ACHHYP_10861 [Achlya hypogyna]|uniref:Transmembrane protein n=1 Tax=Achlya hypogyna TaxID=1202772 RepID=A0A1V9YKF7_ACHHY|nr:hypothetical protein ACHHYP_10861 [Achlya hypogyna]